MNRQAIIYYKSKYQSVSEAKLFGLRIRGGKTSQLLGKHQCENFGNMYIHIRLHLHQKVRNIFSSYLILNITYWSFNKCVTVEGWGRCSRNICQYLTKISGWRGGQDLPVTQRKKETIYFKISQKFQVFRYIKYLHGLTLQRLPQSEWIIVWHVPFSNVCYKTTI